MRRILMIVSTTLMGYLSFGQTSVAVCNNNNADYYQKMDNIHITLPENVQQVVFTLYDMQGKELIRQEVSNRDRVKVNGFAAGIYLYKVVTEKESYQGKLIIKN
jgi:hypothetical protein